MLGGKITVLSAIQECLCPFKKYKWNIPLSWVSWNKGLLFVLCFFFFAWKPNKWTFLCVLANCFQKASLYCPVGNVCLSDDKSSVSMPAPEKWGVVQILLVSRSRKTRFDSPTVTPVALLNALMLGETCTLMLEWNVPFYLSDKGFWFCCFFLLRGSIQQRVEVKLC